MSNPRLSWKRQSLEGESVLHDDSKLAFYAAGQRQLRRTAGELCDLAGSSDTVRITKFLRWKSLSPQPRLESVEG